MVPHLCAFLREGQALALTRQRAGTRNYATQGDLQ
nr:hypothetical protein RNT25_01804 [arsenite-oxidising bacterium NT-25]